MSVQLEKTIKGIIEKKRSISVAEYMNLALAHPEYGYYMGRDPLGAKGDFTTAPEISQVFGEIIGAWLANKWLLLGSPKNVALVELGAGRGTLMADILRATKNLNGFHESISVHIVEISPHLRQKQWKTLAGKHERIEWHKTIDTLPQSPILLVANEFFDALPIRQFVHYYPSPPFTGEGEGKGGGCIERMITINMGKKLCFIPPSPSRGEGFIRETCEPAIAIMRALAKHIKTHKGAGIIIDYGYVGGSAGDTLQAMKNHEYHDVLADVGEADITAHVDFAAIAEAARAEGIIAEDAIPQGAFLMRNGAGERTTKLCASSTPEQQKALISGLKRLADPEEMGELFKVLIIYSS